MRDPKNTGLTNSGRFFNNGKFDIDSAFDYYSTSIINAKTNIKFLVDNPNIDEDIDSLAMNLADEFKTLIIIARNWNLKK
ncbi:MAG: hypothetical protein PHF86_01600 [Candidatus Nanoarchaeia archaeon]|nr:hypothetical protein [Candidatus Nanoarchaeia archaeon]